jgi:hypothetical protein
MYLCFFLLTSAGRWVWVNLGRTIRPSWVHMFGVFQFRWEIFSTVYRKIGQLFVHSHVSKGSKHGSRIDVPIITRYYKRMVGDFQWFIASTEYGFQIRMDNHTPSTIIYQIFDHWWPLHIPSGNQTWHVEIHGFHYRRVSIQDEFFGVGNPT